MYREIVHRGRKKGGRKWVVGTVFIENGRFFIDAPRRYNIKPGKYEVDYETIGEKTGLQESPPLNGDIYEGDVIFTQSFPDAGDTPNIYIVKYSENDGRIRFYDIDLDLYFDYDHPINHFCSKIYVIGNIHKNPEFLDLNFQVRILKDHRIIYALMMDAPLSPKEESIYKNHIKIAKLQTRFEMKIKAIDAKERETKSTEQITISEELPF